MTLVKTPLALRIVAYLLNNLVGGIGPALLTYFLAKGVIDNDLAILLGVAIGLVVNIAGTLALSHLTLPDTSSAPSPALEAPAPAAVLAPTSTSAGGITSTRAAP